MWLMPACHDQLICPQFVNDDQHALATEQEGTLGCGRQAARVSAGTMEVASWGAFRNWRTWALACISMLEAVVKNAILYWCPLIIHSLVRCTAAANMSGLESSWKTACLLVMPIATAPGVCCHKTMHLRSIMFGHLS